MPDTKVNLSAVSSMSADSEARLSQIVFNEAALLPLSTKDNIDLLMSLCTQEGGFVVNETFPVLSATGHPTHRI